LQHAKPDPLRVRSGHPGIGNTIASETRYEEGFLLRKCLAAVTPARQLFREGKLATKLRIKRNPQVIGSSAVEIDVVANLSANSGRRPKGPAKTSIPPPGYTAKDVAPFVRPTVLTNPVCAF
jgi:hypothetical protein